MPGGAAWKDAVSLHDFEALARARMDPEAFDYVVGGAGDEVTLRENAAAYGASAVVVSNHGGRQLDRCPASLDVLEEVVTAIGGRLEVYLDGGVRRGGDVVIALALGARGVF